MKHIRLNNIIKFIKLNNIFIIKNTAILLFNILLYIIYTVFI